MQDTFSWDVWIRLPIDVASCPTRTDSSATLLWKLLHIFTFSDPF